MRTVCCILPGHHFQVRQDPFTWNAACDTVIYALLSSLKIGQPPCGPGIDPGRGRARRTRSTVGSSADGIPAMPPPGHGGKVHSRHDLRAAASLGPVLPQEWQRLFSEGISRAAAKAVRKASGEGRPGRDESYDSRSYAPRPGAAVVHRPLSAPGRPCGASAAPAGQGADARYQITVAAASAELQEIYINPAMGLDEEEWRFVLAHEMLHVGLRHHARCMGRDPFLWNVACDYVVNGWLLEMGIGRMPTMGFACTNRILKGLSAESIYDKIVKDLRHFRRLSTLRGPGLGDILPGGRPQWWEVGEGLGLDDFYRRCLLQGLEYHVAGERGLLPAGLVEEVRALAQPPVPWDVEMARWFDPLFPPVEKRRSYARLSRRQSATPDIPRPSWVVPSQGQDVRTFGVVLDTSGSMDRALLARALGAVAGPALPAIFPPCAWCLRMRRFMTRDS